jgi:histidinol-phosphate/aromatic aminotransferase/cobyric acid decarboxylase-like protein/GNAT superfamily N-acetyltransferase
LFYQLTSGRQGGVLLTGETETRGIIMKTLMTRTAKNPRPISIRLARAEDRELIYRLRHEVYARELAQHKTQPQGALNDSLDDFNIYLIAELRGEIAGFISLTPPGFGRYSIDKYLSRAELPFSVDARLFEARLLTVLKPYRGQALAFLLMYAAFRFVEAKGGTRIVGIGRREVLELYRRMGMQSHGREIRSGAVTFELMSAEVSQLRSRVAGYAGLLNRLERMIDWRLEIPFRAPAKCFHGGAFFDAIGPEFERLQQRRKIINADVLDAWFPPAPKVLAALQANLAWLLQTSPPTGCEGLVRAVARARGVMPECVLPAAGSSDLIFLALRQWLTPDSRVLLLDPTYGEYAHVLEQVVRCRVERFVLAREDGYQVNLARLAKYLERPIDLVILVNPNSPTGRHIPRLELEQLLRRVPARTRVWVDETYVEYAGADESLERFAAGSANVVVCKSMSKVYALSGARAAYLCGAAQTIDELRAITPPWAVSLPAQVAAVTALQDPDYYLRRYSETHRLRAQLVEQLGQFNGWEIVPGTANFLLCHLPEDGLDAVAIVQRCRTHGLFLRDAGAMGSRLGHRVLRIAVKDAATNRQMVAILNNVLWRSMNRSEQPREIAGKLNGETVVLAGV